MKKRKVTYRVWNNMDPNDSFEVKALTAADAVLEALTNLGWCVSAKPVDTEKEGPAHV